MRPGYPLGGPADLYEAALLRLDNDVWEKFNPRGHVYTASGSLVTTGDDVVDAWEQAFDEGLYG